jgi:hypothetical protein
MLPSFPEDMKVTEHGYIIDGRGQITGSPIEAPNKSAIPASSKPQQTVVNFDEYYKVNVEGYRRPEGKLPLMAGYTTHYSERRAHPYTKEDYINVWCSDKKHVGKVDCLTDKYAISFFPVSHWSWGITQAAMRARKFPQKGAAFLYVEDFGADAVAINEAKNWAEQWGVKVMFGTIDAGIPEDWIR